MALSLQRVKHLRSQTRLCRQTRHVALGCSQIYTQIACEIHSAFFSPPLMSVCMCVCVCIRERFVTAYVCRCVCFYPLVLEYHYFSVMNIYQVGFMEFKCCRESSAGDLFNPNPVLSELPGAWKNKLWERM